jgi:hypothetical protein
VRYQQRQEGLYGAPFALFWGAKFKFILKILEKTCICQKKALPLQRIYTKYVLF